MKVYTFGDEEILVSADDQCWKKSDYKTLRGEYDIIYNGGIVGFWLQKRKNYSPLVHIMSEDDGNLYWNHKKDICFDAGWLDDWKDLIDKTQNHIKNHPKKYK